MQNPAYEKWADALTGYSVVVKPGQTVVINGGVAAEPLMRAVYRSVLARGGFPILMPSLPGVAADLLSLGSDAQLEFISPLERFAIAEADVSITIKADINTKGFSGVDPTRQAVFQRARTDLFRTYMERDASGALDWTLTLFPTDAFAQDADMSTDDFATFVYRACKLDEPDPIAAWQALAKEQARLIDWLAGKSEIRLIGPDTDLTLSVAGRTWTNADGRKNFPDGEIFTAPVETATEGHVRFSYPASYAGRSVEDVRLRFEGGKVVDASAARNEEYLIQQLDLDPGARILGEFAFGTNFDITRFTRQILFDEKIGGTVHMAIGEGYPENGSQNHSAVHWDMVCDLRQGGRVDVDGEPFMVEGKFVV